MSAKRSATLYENLHAEFSVSGEESRPAAKCHLFDISPNGARILVGESPIQNLSSFLEGRSKFELHLDFGETLGGRAALQANLGLIEKKKTGSLALGMRFGALSKEDERKIQSLMAQEMQRHASKRMQRFQRSRQKKKIKIMAAVFILCILASILAVKLPDLIGSMAEKFREATGIDEFKEQLNKASKLDKLSPQELEALKKKLDGQKGR